MADLASGDRQIIAGRIYSDVFEKRLDVTPALAEACLQRARVVKGALRFSSDTAFDQALSDGVFLLEIPKGLDITSGDRFAQEFHTGNVSTAYGAFRNVTSEQFGDQLLGFHERINQIEQFLLERRFWAGVYPREIEALAEALTALSRNVICSILARAGLPTSLWPKGAGGCAEAAGAYHLTFNHYRPQFDGVGLASHKDDGFLTILRSTAPGLELNIDTRWERAPVEPDFFVVNFGIAMDILTARCPRPASAIMHRVSHQTHDRTSFGHFSSSNFIESEDAGIFGFRPPATLVRVCGSRELIDANDFEIYAGTTAPEDVL